MIRKPRQFHGEVRHLAFLPPEPRLLLHTPPGVRVWDYGIDKYEMTLGFRSAYPVYLDAAADGRVWLLRTSRGLVSLHHAGPPISVVRLMGSSPGPFVWHQVARAAALSRDGKRVAMLIDDGGRVGHRSRQRVSLRDAANDAEIASLVLEDNFATDCLACSPDGSLVALSLEQSHALIWEPAPGAALVAPDRFAPEHPDPDPPRRPGWGLTAWLSSLVPDRSVPDRPPPVSSWRQSARPQRVPLQSGGDSEAEALAFSADGATLASVSGARVIVWDVATAKRACTLMGHEAEVAAVAFPPAGPLVASISADGTLRLWDWQAERHAERLRIDCDLGKLFALAFSPDGQLAAVGGRKGCGLIELDERMLT